MIKKFSWRRFLLPLLPLIFVIVVLEVFVRMEILPPYLVASPSAVLAAMTVDSTVLWAAFLQTAWTSALGLLLSAALGLLLGTLFSISERTRLAFLPYAVFFQTVPIVAIAPLLVIWIGYGTPTVVAAAFIVSIFPVIASTLTGFQSTDPQMKEIFKLYGADSFALLFKLQLPFALPQIFVGFRIAAGLSVIGAIVGEFIAGGGLGGMVEVARTRQRVDQVFASVILASLIALTWVFIINFSAKTLLKNWHASER